MVRTIQLGYKMARQFIGNSTDYIINGVDQRSIPEQRRAEKEAEMKMKREYERHEAAAKKSRAGQLDRIMGGKNLPKSPSPSDISNGKLRKKSK
jgi:hypothetical protein